MGGVALEVIVLLVVALGARIGSQEGQKGDVYPKDHESGSQPQIAGVGGSSTICEEKRRLPQKKAKCHSRRGAK